MKKSLLLCAAMLLVGAAAAQAQLNLAYTDCGSGISNVNNACTSNTGTNLVQASFVAPAGTVAITGEQGVLDIQIAGGTVPPWWQAVVSGSCRGTAVSVAYNTAGASCADYFNTVGAPLGGFGYDYYPVSATTAPGRVRIRTVSAISSAVASSLDAAGVAPGSDTYVFTTKFTMAKTTGTGSCSGCNLGACWVFNSLLLTQPVGVGDIMLVSPGGSGAFVTWQNGGGIGCPGATPSKTTSWGQVKSLYR